MGASGGTRTEFMSEHGQSMIVNTSTTKHAYTPAATCSGSARALNAANTGYTVIAVNIDTHNRTIAVDMHDGKCMRHDMLYSRCSSGAYFQLYLLPTASLITWMKMTVARPMPQHSDARPLYART